MNHTPYSAHYTVSTPSAFQAKFRHPYCFLWHIQMFSFSYGVLVCQITNIIILFTGINIKSLYGPIPQAVGSQHNFWWNKQPYYKVQKQKLGWCGLEFTISDDMQLKTYWATPTFRLVFLNCLYFLRRILYKGNEESTLVFVSCSNTLRCNRNPCPCCIDPVIRYSFQFQTCKDLYSEQFWQNNSLYKQQALYTRNRYIRCLVQFLYRQQGW